MEASAPIQARQPPAGGPGGAPLPGPARGAARPSVGPALRPAGGLRQPRGRTTARRASRPRRRRRPAGGRSITGGTPTALPVGLQGLRAGRHRHHQAPVRAAAGLALRRGDRRLEAAAPLGLGRMGHRQTLLPDGSILVTGGLVRPGRRRHAGHRRGRGLQPRGRGRTARTSTTRSPPAPAGRGPVAPRPRRRHAPAGALIYTAARHEPASARRSPPLRRRVAGALLLRSRRGGAQGLRQPAAARRLRRGQLPGPQGRRRRPRRGQGRRRLHRARCSSSPTELLEYKVLPSGAFGGTRSSRSATATPRAARTNTLQQHPGGRARRGPPGALLLRQRGPAPPATA